MLAGWSGIEAAPVKNALSPNTASKLPHQSTAMCRCWRLNPVSFEVRDGDPHLTRVAQSGWCAPNGPTRLNRLDPSLTSIVTIIGLGNTLIKHANSGKHVIAALRTVAVAQHYQGEAGWHSPHD